MRVASSRALACLASAVFAAAVALQPALASAEADDQIPGVSMPPSPVAGNLDESSDWDDVYKIYLEEDQTLDLALNGDPGSDFDLYVFPPSATDVGDEADAVAMSTLAAYPDGIYFQAPEAGWYYVDVYADAGAGGYTLSWLPSGTGPAGGAFAVWRFTHLWTGSFFYTASAAEKDHVIATLSHIYRYDGEAYWVSLANPANRAPLYRFYIRRSGTHFYTADPDERDWVEANLYPEYRLEGPGYSVSTTASGMVPVHRFYDPVGDTWFYTTSMSEKTAAETVGSWKWEYDGVGFFVDAPGTARSFGPDPPASAYMPVYRFYNPSKGVHFFTASATERDNVIRTLRRVYNYEGVSYQVNTASRRATQPLHRFYNPSKGVHFYTASDAEKDNVIRTLSRYYTYEGIAYYVSTDPADTPAYRFYCPSKGVHFYTASEAEKNNIISGLSWLYNFEGPSFYVPK